jgi:hypothetical protein
MILTFTCFPNSANNRTVTAYGDLGDPGSALWLLSNFYSSSTRTWNVFLGALAKTIERNLTGVLCSESSVVSTVFPVATIQSHRHKTIGDVLEGLTFVEATKVILYLMSESIVIEGLAIPQPNSQTYCIAATALQGTVNATFALSMFRNSIAQGLVADGRFVNAIFRCYGSDIDLAVHDWKTEIRPRCASYESQNAFYRLRRNENIVACYHGLFYVSGRANRPDIALRLAYAMKREGLEPNEQALNSYKSGLRVRRSSILSNMATTFAQKFQIMNAYESMLEIECTRYNQNDRRRQGEARVRIIV